MKKMISLVFGLLMSSSTVLAQDGYNDTKHEVAVSMGWLSNSQWIDVLEDFTITALTGVKYEDDHFIGPVSAEYFFHAKKWLGVGGIAVFGQNKQDFYIGDTKDGQYTNTYYTLMPAVKFDWLRKKYFGMYSKLGIGATLRHEGADYVNSESEDYSNTALHVNWQVSLLGIEAGGPYMRGFLELGNGEQGIALIGLRYKF